jgi:hypothetical protein
VFSVDRKVFPLTGKCFPLTNFSNIKQTQKSLESGFPENEFQETNMSLESLFFHPTRVQQRLVVNSSEQDERLLSGL